jgi:acetate kinase
VRVLVLNAGSSTLKWTLLEGRNRTTIQSGEQEWRAHDGRAHQVRATLREVSAFDAVGHRVVHGGTRFRHAVVIDREVRLRSRLRVDPSRGIIAAHA